MNDALRSEEMKNKYLNLSIIILSMICLIISIKTFYNLGIYVDEYNTSPSGVLGGEIWVYSQWINFGVNAIICILAGIGFIKKQ